ncbi:MAG: protein-L-isoaspartate(D-aspartate) O-methyltransferase [Deltaproteobacteria bacterium]|nr:protein-L-isoaspartate(D-aspartate) O-methyltransferase [Deltaproteobacteria bacterium]
MFDRARRRMVAEQLEGRGIRDPRLLHAMGRVPRHEFLEEALRHRAYEEFALPIGYGQTISHPYTVALMTEALELQGHERVLEVGTGSGYQTAVLAALCANVFTIERLAALAMRARKVLDSQAIYNVALQIGDGTIGWKAEAPFDAILVAAGGPDLPRPLLSQLRRGGRLVVPVGDGDSQSLLRLRLEDSGIREEVIADCRFVKLLGRFGFAR